MGLLATFETHTTCFDTLGASLLSELANIESLIKSFASNTAAFFALVARKKIILDALSSLKTKRTCNTTSKKKTDWSFLFFLLLLIKKRNRQPMRPVPKMAL